MNMNIQDYVSIYNAIDKLTCKQIVDEFVNSNWEKHSYNDPITKENKTYDDDLDISYQTTYTQYLNEKIKLCLTDYIKNVANTQFGIQDFSDIRFNKYEVGTNMKFHYDHIHTLFDGERKGIPILTILALLNDDFEGGDFLMFDSKRVQLEAGDIIIFPSNFLYPHAVETVTKGTRYSFVSWAW